MKVSFGGIGETVCTFYNCQTNPAKAEQPVKMSGNGEVGAPADGERFCGVAVNVSEAFASVQTGGFVLVTYSGASVPSAGYCGLVSDGNGGVRVDSAGGEYLVIDVDATAKTIGFML